MTQPASAAGLTGAMVAAGIAAAGTVAWAVTVLDPAAEMKGAAAAPADASAPIDLTRLHAGADPLSLEQGRIYYVQLCLDCHGARGDGRGEWAYRVTPRPANLTSPKTRARSDAQLFELISEPQPGTPMIGWKKQLSENQRRQLVTYVRHLSIGAGRETRH
jgi:mono/diheme cytochrome c family protein